MEPNRINDEEFLESVKEAAREGAKNGAKGVTFTSGIISIVAPAILVALVAIVGYFFIKNALANTLTGKWDEFLADAKSQFTFDDPAESHDMVLDDDGFLGYTAADFAEAMLGDSNKLKKMEVYEVKVSDAVTLTDTGIGNVKIFTKTQVITYNGTAVYTVDLSELTGDDIVYNEDNCEIVLYIPHTQRENINIPSEEMEFGDTTKGWLAFGEITMTAEEQANVETEAKKRMELKLEQTKASEAADRFAKMTIWELYQPIVSSVSPDVKLTVEFK